MTETTTEQAPVQTFNSELQSVAFRELEAQIQERNILVANANAASGDRLDLTEQLTENSTDPAIVEARERRDAAINDLYNLVNPAVAEQIAAGSEGIAETVAKISDIDGELKAGLNYYKKAFGEEAFEFFSKMSKIKGTRVSNAGTGGRRIRGFNFSVTANGQIEEFENAASVAKWLDEDTAKVQEAFFEAAGNPGAVKDAPDKVSFDVEFTETDEDGETSVSTAHIVAYRPDSDADVASDPEPEVVEEAEDEVSDEYDTSDL